MNSLDVLTRIYKPYKVTIRGKSCIFNTTSGDIVLKKRGDKNISDLYKYLSSRSFTYFPKLIEDNRDYYNVFEYVSDVSIDNEQKLYDLMDLVSLLHSKTSFYKEITHDKIKEIYELLLGRVEYINESINNYIEVIEDNVFYSPSECIFIYYSSKIIDLINFIKNEIEEWYKLCIDLKKFRVCVVHNNLSLDHFIKNESDYLISWDNYIIDTPIIDIVSLYKRVYMDMDFSSSLNHYLEKCSLTNEEKKLLFIMITIPDVIKFGDDELSNVYEVRKFYDYIYKTEDLIKEFYSK